MLKPPRHRIYLLRCWEEREQYRNCASIWRFILEDAQTGQRHGFANLEALTDFVQATLGCDEQKSHNDNTD